MTAPLTLLQYFEGTIFKVVKTVTEHVSKSSSGFDYSNLEALMCVQIVMYIDANQRHQVCAIKCIINISQVFLYSVSQFYQGIFSNFEIPMVLFCFRSGNEINSHVAIEVALYITPILNLWPFEGDLFENKILEPPMMKPFHLSHRSGVGVRFELL